MTWVCVRGISGADPGFFLVGGTPLRNSVTKNTNTKKKAFDETISELLRIHIKKRYISFCMTVKRTAQ